MITRFVKRPLGMVLQQNIRRHQRKSAPFATTNMRPMTTMLTTNQYYAQHLLLVVGYHHHGAQEVEGGDDNAWKVVATSFAVIVSYNTVKLPF